MTAPLGVALPVMTPPEGEHDPPLVVWTYSIDPPPKLLHVPEIARFAYEPVQLLEELYPSTTPPHWTATGAPQLQVVQPRVSSAPVYSVCFVPNGHATSPGTVAHSTKPGGMAGTQRSFAPHEPCSTGSVALHASTVLAHVSGGTSVVGCAAQLPPDTE
ncbi:MAG: hypothetical protein ACRELB_21860 [Polyangiaceae bacterium]